MDKLIDYIRVYHNAIPDDLCDRLIAEFDTSDDMELGKFGENGGQVLPHLRHCLVSPISYQKVPTPARLNLDNELYSCFASAMNEYMSEFEFVTIQRDTGSMLVKYEKGHYFNEHTDASANSQKTIACVAYANDDFTGGEFSFFNNTYYPEMKKGSLILFPATFMYPHAVATVTSGNRYSIINWFM